MIDPAFAHILIIEDADDTYFVLQNMLTYDVGVRSCTRCRDGRTLLDMLDGRTTALFDLVLYDIKRPLRDAFALLPILKQHPKLVMSHFVAVTANIMPEDIERARDAGFDGFIGIPIDHDRFPEQIRRLLNDQYVWEPR
ncbi:MAG: response regulator [Herpetosiphon sp.]|nr:response regulator [Herpetosiphon sp.]